jgi:tetratricopeptide (TPR) repeat protein
MVHPDLDLIGPPPLPALLSIEAADVCIGRGAERDTLTHAWHAARRGERRVVLVTGEPGIGKTTLTATAAHAAYEDGAIVLAGRCDEGLGVPYQPFVEALAHLARHARVKAADLGPLAGELARLVPELSDQVRGLPAPMAAEPETERYRMFEAVAGWLSAMSASVPILLVIEDLHWAATPTLLLLRHMLRSSEPMHLLVIATYRDTEVGEELGELLADLRLEAGAEQLPLIGLSAHHVAELAGDPDSGAALHAATAGNPLFVGELVRHRAESGDAAPPQSVRDVLRRRIGRLPAGTADVLTTAAVIGAEFESGLVADAMGLSEVETLDMLDVAVNARLVSMRGDRWAFVHDLMRATVVDGLARARRATLHRSVALALETRHHDGDRLAELAHHWCGAAPLGDTVPAVTYARLAGDQARAHLAMEDAAAWYQRALDVLDLDRAGAAGLRCDLQISRGDALHRMGDERHRSLLLEAASGARALMDSHRIGQAALALSPPSGFFSAIGAVDADVVALAEEALAALPDTRDTDALRARLLGAIASELTFSSAHDRRKALSAEALERARRSGDEETLGRILYIHQWAGSDPAHLDERSLCAIELTALGQRRDDRELAVLGHLQQYESLVELGEVTRADEQLADGERLVGDLPPVYAWFVAYRRVAQAMLAGRLADAERRANEATQLGYADNSVNGTTAAQLCFIRGDQGRAGEAIDTMTVLAAFAPTMPVYRMAQAALEADAGRLDEARATLDAVAADGYESLPADYGWLGACVLKTWAVTKLDDPTRCAALYEQLRPYAGRIAWVAVLSPGPVDLALAILAATLGRFDDAEAHFAASLALCERNNTKTFAARTRCAWAAMLATRGEHERSRSLASDAVVAAASLGLATIEREARALLATA